MSFVGFTGARSLRDEWPALVAEVIGVHYA